MALHKKDKLVMLIVNNKKGAGYYETKNCKRSRAVSLKGKSLFFVDTEVRQGGRVL